MLTGFFLIVGSILLLVGVMLLRHERTNRGLAEAAHGLITTGKLDEDDNADLALETYRLSETRDEASGGIVLAVVARVLIIAAVACFAVAVFHWYT